MEVDGMQGHDGRDTERETLARLPQACLDRELGIGCRLEFNSAREMQNFKAVEVGRQQRSWAVLRHPDSMLRPGSVRIFICAVSRGTSRTRQRGKYLREGADGVANQFFLDFGGQKSLILRLLRIPVFITDPWHPPVNIRRSCLPQRVEESTAIAVVLQTALHCRTTEMYRTVESRLEDAVANAAAIAFEQIGAVPTLRETFR